MLTLLAFADETGASGLDGQGRMVAVRHQL